MHVFEGVSNFDTLTNEQADLMNEVEMKKTHLLFIRQKSATKN